MPHIPKSELIERKPTIPLEEVQMEEAKEVKPSIPLSEVKAAREALAAAPPDIDRDIDLVGRRVGTLWASVFTAMIAGTGCPPDHWGPFVQPATTLVQQLLPAFGARLTQPPRPRENAKEG